MKVFQFYVRSMLNQLEFQICFGFLCLMMNNLGLIEPSVRHG